MIQIPNSKFSPRLIFLKQGESIPNAPSTAPSAGPREDLGSLAADLKPFLQKKLETAVGQKIDWNNLQYNPEGLAKLWERLFEAPISPDALSAFGAAFFGKKPSDIERDLAEYFGAPIPAGGHNLENVPRAIDPEIIVDERKEEKSGASPERITSKQSRDGAEHALLALAEHPDYEQWIDLSSQHWGFRRSLYVALIYGESRFNPHSTTEEASAIGLAQALAKGRKRYVEERYAAFKAEIQNHPNAPKLPDSVDPGNASKTGDLFKIPAVAIDFIGWHMHHQITYANITAKKEGLPEYILTPNSETKWLYSAYGNGGRGYVVLRRFLESKTPKERDGNYAQLTAFHRQTHVYKGRRVEKWHSKNDYADYVAAIEANYIALQTPLSQDYFDSPPLTSGFAVSQRGHFGPRYSHYHGASMEKSNRADWRLHNGIDIPAQEGTPVLAVKRGIVEAAQRDARRGGISGINVVIRHDNGDKSSYVHLSAITPRLDVGDRVNAGQEIGKVGQTGRAEGPHLHFTYRDAAGRYRNPEVAAVAAVERRRSTAVV